MDLLDYRVRRGRQEAVDQDCGPRDRLRDNDPAMPSISASTSVRGTSSRFSIMRNCRRQSTIAY
jgi:hypothetical protein